MALVYSSESRVGLYDPTVLSAHGIFGRVGLRMKQISFIFCTVVLGLGLILVFFYFIIEKPELWGAVLLLTGVCFIAYLNTLFADLIRIIKGKDDF